MSNDCVTFCGYCGLQRDSDTFCDAMCEDAYTINLSATHEWFETLKLSNGLVELTSEDVLCLMGASDARTRERYSKELFACPNIKMTHSGEWELHAWVSFRKHTAGITISRSVSRIVTLPFERILRMLTIQNLIGHPHIFKEDKDLLMSYMYANTNESKYLSKEAVELFVF